MPSNPLDMKYNRVLLKLSGEALMGDREFGIDPKRIAEYAEEIKSPIADLKNLGGPYAGMITAGKFLEHFVEAPYIHIDL